MQSRSLIIQKTNLNLDEKKNSKDAVNNKDNTNIEII